MTTPRVIAVTDCEVVIVEESAAGHVASRNPALSEAFSQLSDTRRRRIERMIEAAGRKDPANESGDSGIERGRS